MPDRWADPAFLRGSQYTTDVNLAARQSIYACQHPLIDLAARVRDLAGPSPSSLVVDIGCGNGMYLAELACRASPAEYSASTCQPACCPPPATG